MTSKVLKKSSDTYWCTLIRIAGHPIEFKIYDDDMRTYINLTPELLSFPEAKS